MPGVTLAPGTCQPASVTGPGGVCHDRGMHTALGCTVMLLLGAQGPGAGREAFIRDAVVAGGAPAQSFEAQDPPDEPLAEAPSSARGRATLWVGALAAAAAACGVVGAGGALGGSVAPLACGVAVGSCVSPVPLVATLVLVVPVAVLLEGVLGLALTGQAMVTALSPGWFTSANATKMRTLLLAQAVPLGLGFVAASALGWAAAALLLGTWSALGYMALTSTDDLAPWAVFAFLGTLLWVPVLAALGVLVAAVAQGVAWVWAFQTARGFSPSDAPWPGRRASGAAPAPQQDDEASEYEGPLEDLP